MVRVCQVGVLDVLRVICGQASKDQHTQNRDRKVDRRGAQEDVDDRRNQNTDHTHDQERAPAGDVFLGGVAVERQTRKGDRGHKEDMRDREAGEGDEDPAQGQAHDGCESIEEQLRASGGQAVDRSTEQEDHAQRREHHDPTKDIRLQGRRVTEHAQQSRGSTHGPCHGECQQHADRHGAVNFVHMGPKTRINLSRAGTGHAADCFIFSHLSLRY